MADLIEGLDHLPYEEQETFLRNLSEEMIPLEINGDIFMIHKNVSKLIDGLVFQLENLKNKNNKNVRKKSN